MANTKITTNVIADGAITSAKLDSSSLSIPSTATATTQSAGDNSTKVATTAYVETAVSNLVSAAPAALDTLDELAAALGDDANFATTITNSLALKAPLASPDFTGDVTFDTSTLVIDSTNNRVGIGTDSPDEKLHVHASDSGNSYAAFTNATTGLTTEFLVGINAAEDALVYNENNSNMIFATNNLERMRITDGGQIKSIRDNTGNESYINLELKNTATSAGLSLDCADGVNGKKYEIQSNTSGNFFVYDRTSSAYRFLIDTSGNVGIGTTDPNAGLQIALGGIGVPSAGADTGSAVFGNTTSGNAYGLVVGATNSGTGYITAQRTDGTATTYDLAIQPNGGNVGIGTTSPDSQSALTLVLPTAVNGRILSMYRAAGAYGYHLGIDANSKFNLYNNDGTSSLFTVDSSGNVGIGTTNSSGSLHILNTSGGQAPANYLNIQGATANNSNYPGVVFTGGSLANVYPYISLSNGGLALSLVAGRHTTNYNNAANIILQGSTGDIIFSTNSGSSSGVEKMRLQSNGYLNVKDGILFGSDTAAANALDDYEEGTWTSSIHASTASTVTFSSGYYTKIGNMVFANFALSVNSQANGDNFVAISGPFVQHQNNITWTGYCTNYNYGDRRSGIVINNSSGNNTQWFVGWSSNSTAAATIRGVIVYQTT